MTTYRSEELAQSGSRWALRGARDHFLTADNIVLREGQCEHLVSALFGGNIH